MELRVRFDEIQAAMKPAQGRTSIDERNSSIGNDSTSTVASAFPSPPPATATGSRKSARIAAGLMDDYAIVGIPTGLLWLPYTVLSAVLIGLMLVSFVRFHRKRIEKFRARREQVWRQQLISRLSGREKPGPSLSSGSVQPRRPNPQDLSTSSNGGIRLNSAKDFRGVRRLKSEYQTDAGTELVTETAMLQQKAVTLLPPTGRTSGRCASAKATSGPSISFASGDVVAGAKQTHRPETSSYQPHQPVCRSSPQHLLESSVTGRTKRSLSFISNPNGSMVDLRCGEQESLVTFRKPIKPDIPCVPCAKSRSNSSQTKHEPQVWTTSTSGLNAESRLSPFMLRENRGSVSITQNMPNHTTCNTSTQTPRDEIALDQIPRNQIHFGRNPSDQIRSNRNSPDQIHSGKSQRDQIRLGENLRIQSGQNSRDRMQLGHSTRDRIQLNQQRREGIRPDQS